MLSRCKRDDTRGGSHRETLRLRNHPPRDPLRDPAALLTKEGRTDYGIHVNVSRTRYNFRRSIKDANLELLKTRIEFAGNLAE